MGRTQSIDKRSARARRRVRTIKQAEILQWYLTLSEGVMPMEQCEKTDAYGEYTWWLEPPIPGVENPVLVEHTTGTWRLDIQRMVIKPRVFIP